MKLKRAVGLALATVLILALHAKAQNFTVQVGHGIPALSNATANWVDFNNDSKPDLFISGTNSGGSLHTAVYLNNGNNTFNVITLTALNDIGIDFGDYNNDGFIDILMSGITSTSVRKTILYRNTNGTGFVEEADGFTNLSKGGVLWKDLDNDSDLDVVLTGIDESNHEQTLFYEYLDGQYVTVSNTLPDVSNGDIASIDVNNDGTTEIIVSGMKGNGTPFMGIYSVSNKFSISAYATNFTGSAFNAITVADINSDGYEDLLIAGLAGEGMDKETTILQNNGLGGFVNVSNSFPDVSSASIDAGDLNNDGKTDIILTGIDANGSKYFKYYKKGSGFTDVAHAMPNIYNGDASLIDFDNDGDLDIFQIGNSDISFQANLYLSDQASTTSNDSPGTPANLTASVVEDSVYLEWDASTDALTTSTGITYNIYVSTSANGNGLVTSPLSNLSTGYRLIQKTGNAGFKNSLAIHALPEGKYYWSVQAIDNGIKGSAFAAEQSFSVCYSFSIGQDTIICKDDDITLQAGEVGDNVNWYSKSDGLLLSGNRNITHTIAHNDTLIAEVEKPYGCTVKDTILIAMSTPPDVSLGADVSICDGQQFSKTISSSVDSVNWYNTLQTLQLNSHSYHYTVVVKDTIIARFYNEHKCVSEDSIIVDVYELPQFSAGIDRSICFEQNTVFEVTGSWETVNWSSTQKGELANDADTYLYQVTEKDTVIASVEDNHGCINYDSAIVEVFSLPVIDLGINRSVCFEQMAELQLTGTGQTIQWLDENDNVLASDVSSYEYQVLTDREIFVKAIDANQCVSFDSVEVHVLPLPAFNLGRDTAVCFDEDILLQTASGFNRVDWLSRNLADTVNANSWFYNHPVTKTDTLIAIVRHNNGCLNYDSIRVEMLPLPTFSLGEDIDICFKEQFRLEVAGSSRVVNWYTNDDLLLEENNPVFQYVAETSMQLWAKATDIHNCISYDTIDINVHTLPEFSLGEDRSVCRGDQVSISAADVAVSYDWSDGNTSVGHDHEFAFTAADSRTLVLKVADSYTCVYRDTIDVIVNTLPDFSVSGLKEICKGDTALLEINYPNWQSISWNRGENQLSNTAKLERSFTETSDIEVTLTDDHNCVTTKTVSLVVNARPMANAGVDLLLCFGERTQLGSDPIEGDIYLWGADASLSDVTSATPTAKPTETTEYTLKVVNQKNCVSYDTVRIEVNPQIIVDAGENKAICIGESTTIGGNPTATGSNFGYTYQWMKDDETMDAISANVVVTPTVSARYFVLVSSGECSVEIDSIDITVNPLPIVTIIEDQSIGSGSSVELLAEGGIKYSWTPASSLDNATFKNPVASPLVTTNYKVLVTDANNCSDTASVDVLVQNNIFIPNVFSPNGDGKNDTFKVYGSGVKEIILTVFDQKGNQVFKTSDHNTAFETGWDGTHAGKTLKDDIYIWTIDGIFYNGDRVSFEGKNNGIIKLLR